MTPRLLLLGLFLATQSIFSFAQQVTVTSTPFGHLPEKLFYFKGSDNILWLDSSSHTVFRSEDYGKQWAKVAGIKEGDAFFLYEHPFDHDKAYIIGKGKTHWKTEDQGVTWQSFESLTEPANGNQVLSFHAQRPGHVLFFGFQCDAQGWGAPDCHVQASYTTNNFGESKVLRDHVSHCIWSVSSEQFSTAPTNEVMCVEPPTDTKKTSGFNSLDPKDFHLVQSEDFFETVQVVNFDKSKPVNGVVAVSAIHRYMIAAAKSSTDSSADMDLYVSLDGEKWHEAVFPSGTTVSEEAYTIVESTSTSLLVDMLDTHAAFGSLYRSNSNGTYFVKSLDHTNRNAMGIIDFERIQGVEGVMITNVVSNHQDIASGRSNDKSLQTRISFDDGATWNSISKVKDNSGQPMQCREQGNHCQLHLHSVTSPHNAGQVFSSVTAVGLVMGVGSYSDHLLPYDDCDTFLSTDGGISWTLTGEGAHKYEFGDMGAILVLVDDEKATDHFWWSSNRGDSWQRHDLGKQIRARILTTDPESTSRNFLLVASLSHSSTSVEAIHIDFTHLFDRQCVLDQHDDDKSDFERWYARDLTDGPDCLMGHEQAFYRRKADRDCYIGKDFQEPEMELKNCACTPADYECDYNFNRDDQGKCVRIAPDAVDAGECKSPDDSYLASSGYRLIPGNTCELDKNAKALDEPEQRACRDNAVASSPKNGHDVHPSNDKDSEKDAHSSPGSATTTAAPAEQGIRKFQTTFDDDIDQFMYFADSPRVLMRLHNGQLWYSPEHGMSWKQVLADQGRILHVVMHEFKNDRAYAFTDNMLYMTTDQGENWQRVDTPGPPATRSNTQILDFHPEEPDWLLLAADDPSSHRTDAYISHNHGRSWDAFHMHVEKCIFGRDSKFNIRKETVYCSVHPSPQSTQIQLVRTVDWGQSKELLFDNLVEYFVVEDFMAVAATVRGELNLFVSVNGDTFAEAQFPPGLYIDRDTFTVLQSTTHSILLNIFKSISSGKAHGTLYKSNDNGTFYHVSLDNTNGNMMGFVDFEKMQGVDGIIMANQVTNAEDLVGGAHDVAKKVRSMISWDDGGHWQPLDPPRRSDCKGKGCTLNLHSRTDIHGPGAIFSAGSVPGLAMGVGNVGESLLPYEQSDTFITRDAGHNWDIIQEGEHLYEFGDQGSILVLINDEGPTSELKYSWDQGEHFRSFQFADEPIRVSTLTTDPRSSTLRFVIIGHTRGRQRSPVVITVDFSETEGVPNCSLDERNEDKSDFERWVAKDDDGDDACLLGRKTAYWRRKRDRVCKVGNRFKDPVTIVENCQCRDIDFECDFGFWRNEDGECVYSNRHPDRPTNCKPGSSFRGRSGYKKNAESTCSGGVNLEQDKDWECGQEGKVQSSKMVFTDRVVDYIYFTDTNRVFIRTADNKVWRSDDDGDHWLQVFEAHQVVAIYQNPHHDKIAYFITNGRTHFVTQDRGSNFNEFNTPLPPLSNIVGNIFSFHRDESDYAIFVGEEGCAGFITNNCHAEAFYTHNSGQTWHRIESYVRNCIWGRSGAIELAEHDAIFCEEYHDKTGNQRTFFSNPVQFVASDNYFESRQYLFDDMVGVAVFGRFMVVAVSQHGGSNLKLYVSLDGKSFAPAQFPENFAVTPEAFTIMESTYSMWIHVSTNTHKGSEYGNIFTSNSNGTYFVLSLADTNRNDLGIVDFEKMQGIEGISLANQVANPAQANMGDPKKLVTRLTADAGRSWQHLPPPNLDSKKEPFKCEKKDDCYLHLHSYSERRNTRDLFSMSGAVGLMVGVGNVGSSLSDYRDGDVFMTRDAGKSWSEVYKGAHIWEFADQGGLLMLVDDEDETHQVKYTSDQGLTWDTYDFSNKKDRIKVEDIITQPDGTSQKYIVLGSERSSGKYVAYHIDFSELHPTQCRLDINNEDDDDFELWSPESIRGDKCLFGRETLFYRRIQDRDCYLGEKLVQPKEIVRNCTCTDLDFECDFNFVRNEKNQCVLVPGYEPVVPECDGTVDYVYYPSGYRKTAASSCQGGTEMDKQGDMIRCPGRPGGGSSWAWFIFGPLIGASAVFACVRYRHVLRAHSRFGSIRLTDGNGAASEGLLSHPIFAKIASAVVIVPVVLVGLLSKVTLPRSLSDLSIFQRIRLPTFMQRSGPQYSPLDQDETDVLLDDYDAASDSDASEL
ncbi:Oligoxyloglucan reducing end-specific cellobiohydrolase [Hesseltinella vesiculosa]|uniref:Oligoxyloglucan reducing end-specific cellobiohydrolase n=1 Tax=Hesseltinella vesiculosa TaxID=101127 RepID=A0A1X2G2G2_9FUNG|nr:Oligoxyloglucan reducing end-specific cellobiohydrolase [Hesseltinella vesiculosa]